MSAKFCSEILWWMAQSEAMDQKSFRKLADDLVSNMSNANDIDCRYKFKRKGWDSWMKERYYTFLYFYTFLYIFMFFIVFLYSFILFYTFYIFDSYSFYALIKMYKKDKSFKYALDMISKRLFFLRGNLNFKTKNILKECMKETFYRNEIIDRIIS